VVKFSSKSADTSVQCLSNFAALAVTIDDVRYSSGEHAFHGSKFLYCASKQTQSSERLNDLRERARIFVQPSSLNTGVNAKRAGGKSKRYGFELTQDELAGWEKEAYRVQTTICRYKMNHYVEVQQALVENKSKLLLHQDNRAKSNTLWGGRIDPSKRDKHTVTMDDIIGQNKLGIIWMNLQSETWNNGKKRCSNDNEEADSTVMAEMKRTKRSNPV
jgi:predicted NAD-dependent protein-ADP-ribosyltransferase YbiA (DUF1768 family)